MTGNHISHAGKYTFDIPLYGVTLEVTALVTGTVPSDFDIDIQQVRMTADTNRDILDFIESVQSMQAVPVYSILQARIREKINLAGGV